jgi:hypothetical protein
MSVSRTRGAPGSEVLYDLRQDMSEEVPDLGWQEGFWPATSWLWKFHPKLRSRVFEDEDGEMLVAVYHPLCPGPRKLWMYPLLTFPDMCGMPDLKPVCELDMERFVSSVEKFYYDRSGKKKKTAEPMPTFQELLKLTGVEAVLVSEPVLSK